MLQNEVVIMVIKFWKETKNYQIVHFKRVNVMVCEL